jgi:hypothetical protein
MCEVHRNIAATITVWWGRGNEVEREDTRDRWINASIYDRGATACDPLLANTES